MKYLYRPDTGERVLRGGGSLYCVVFGIFSLVDSLGSASVLNGLLEWDEEGKCLTGVTSRVSRSEDSTLSLSFDFVTRASGILSCRVARFELALQAGVLKEVACFSSAEPVVSHELDVRDPRFSSLGAFDETDDSASRDKDETINEDLDVDSIIIRELLVDSSLDDLGFILLSDGEAAHVGVLDKVPAFMSIQLLVK
jgi:hypothetical protein